MQDQAKTRRGEADGVLATVRAEVTHAIRLALGIGAVAIVATLVGLLLRMEVYRLVVPTGSMPTAVGLAAGFLLTAALIVGLAHLRSLTLLAAGNRLARRLSAPAVLTAAARSGEPASTCGSLLADIEEIRRAVSDSLCSAALDIALAPVTLLILWVLNPWFALVALCSCVIAATVSLRAEKKALEALSTTNALSGRTAGLVVDAMRCAEAVEAMGMRPALARRWLKDLGQGSERLQAAQETGRRLTATTSALQSLTAGLVMILGASFTLQGENLGIGLMAAMILTGRLIEPFTHLGAANQDWAAAAAAWKRLDDQLGRKSEHPVTQGERFDCPEGRLVLDRLTYLHPRTPRPLLREVGLVIEPGSVTAISGQAGSGKTTLLRLMMGMIRPTAGGVFLDGHAVSQWSREDLARHIGFLPQDPSLGEGTISEAIARLSADPDLGAVLHAARLTGADRMIARLPFGYATSVAGAGESGLSMGQRQRIALARAVYGSPRILLLDEPTAWLDAEGEAAFGELISHLRGQGTAVVMSSHRPAVLALADRLLVVSPDGSLRSATPAPDAPGSAKVITFNAKPAA